MPTTLSRQGLMDFVSERKTEGIIAVFGVSTLDGSLDDILTLRLDNGVIRVTGVLEMLPAIFNEVLPLAPVEQLVMGYSESYSVATGVSIRAPILHTIYKWSKFLDEAVGEVEVATLRNGFVTVDHQLPPDQLWSSIQCWIGDLGNTNLEQIYEMCAFNAMQSGDERQSYVGS